LRYKCLCKILNSSMGFQLMVELSICLDNHHFLSNHRLSVKTMQGSTGVPSMQMDSKVYQFRKTQFSLTIMLANKEMISS
jgi:hypothetical protein